jgi:hypothetical protein
MTSLSTAARGLFALVGVLALAACSNPVSSGDHTRPLGVEVVGDGGVLIRALAASREANPVITGQLTVQAGEQTAPLTVRFLAAGGEAIPPPQGYYLRVTSGNPGIVTWQQATEGEFGGRLVGVGAGSSTLVFDFMHGAVGRGHSDQSFTLPVTVQP